MQMIPLRKVTSNLSLSQRDLNQSFIEGIWSDESVSFRPKSQ
jgi:hypothetical protein